MIKNNERNKNILRLSVLLCVVIISCEKTKPITHQTNTSDARQTASAIFESFYGLQTKGEVTGSRSVEYVRDSGAIAVNMHPNGFVLFQNNKEKTPLIICDEGEFSDLYDNPISAKYLASILKQIPGHHERYDPDPSFSWMEERNVQVDSVIVEPIISVKWHQQAPFNLYAPNGYAGCFPVAWAQIMSVYSYPTTLEITYSGADVTQTNLDWPQLLLHNYVEMTLPPPFGFVSNHLKDTCEICKQSGRLLRQLGEIFGSTYGPGGTSTALINSTMLMDVGYTATTDFYEINTVLGNIQSGIPVLLLAGNGVDSHAYDADGYKIKTRSYDLFVYESGVWQYDSHNVREQTYLHFNYGWFGGMANGYYIVLDKETTQTSNGGSPVVSTYINSPQGFDYNLMSMAIYGIEPDD